MPVAGGDGALNNPSKEWAEKFWDDLVEGPVVLRFVVTDKEKAKDRSAPGLFRAAHHQTACI